MNIQQLEDYCYSFAEKKYDLEDPAHWLDHIMRVVNNAKYIAQHEWWDLEIIIPAAYFHDYVNPPKNSPEALTATENSAAAAEEVLRALEWYPTEKIEPVRYSIMVCSFTKNAPKETLEAKILQDADLLESTWAISIMRTSVSCGVMKRALFDVVDPLWELREPDPTVSAFDLINYRLKIVIERFQTQTWRRLWEKRHQHLLQLEEMLREEILQTKM